MSSPVSLSKRSIDIGLESSRRGLDGVISRARLEREVLSTSSNSSGVYTPSIRPGAYSRHHSRAPRSLNILSSSFCQLSLMPPCLFLVCHFFTVPFRSEEHTSKLQSQMRTSYAV